MDLISISVDLFSHSRSLEKLNPFQMYCFFKLRKEGRKRERESQSVASHTCPAWESNLPAFGVILMCILKKNSINDFK